MLKLIDDEFMRKVFRNVKEKINLVPDFLLKKQLNEWDIEENRYYYYDDESDCCIIKDCDERGQPRSEMICKKKEDIEKVLINNFLRSEAVLHAYPCMQRPVPTSTLDICKGMDVTEIIKKRMEYCWSVIERNGNK